MNKSGYIFGVILLITLTFASVNATLMCYRCNTEQSNNNCDDPFNPYDVTSPRLSILINCTHPYGYNDFSIQQKRPACKKSVQEIYGKKVISRSCQWIDINESHDKCFYDSSPAYTRTTFCETCSTDGCNGANGIIPIASIILIPGLLAKMLMI